MSNGGTLPRDKAVGTWNWLLIHAVPRLRTCGVTHPFLHVPPCYRAYWRIHITFPFTNSILLFFCIFLLIWFFATGFDLLLITFLSFSLTLVTPFLLLFFFKFHPLIWFYFYFWLPVSFFAPYFSVSLFLSSLPHPVTSLPPPCFFLHPPQFSFWCWEQTVFRYFTSLAFPP